MNTHMHMQCSVVRYIMLYFPPFPALSSPPDDGTYFPNWVQCTTPLPLNSSLVNKTLMECSLTKQLNGTVLRVTWDGNIALEGCTTCCMRWEVTIAGANCSDPGTIDAAITQDLSDITTPVDIRRPATVMGICRGVEGVEPGMPPGQYTVGLRVVPCAGGGGGMYNVVTGYNSVSRFIVEEIPDQDEADCIRTQ